MLQRNIVQVFYASIILTLFLLLILFKILGVTFEARAAYPLF